MPGPVEPVQFRFGLNGLVSKGDPELLGDGAYRSILNMDALQEGLLYSRTGRKQIGVLPNPGGRSLTCTMIRKLLISQTEFPLSPSTNPRYIGVYNSPAFAHYDLYRTFDYVTFTLVASNISFISLGPVNRFSMSPYSSGGTGAPWAFIAADQAMLKDRGSAPYTVPLPPSRSFPAGGNLLPLWGILPAFGVAYCDYGIAGNLDSSAAGSTPYDYRYTYVGQDTGNESSPSQTMTENLVGTGGLQRATDSLNFYVVISPVNQQVTVRCWMTDDPQVSTIKIYRRGGILADGVWRLVGSIPNTGTLGVLSATFTDNTSDADIVFQPQLELDNDPPVPSKPPTPLVFTLSASPGRQTVGTSALLPLLRPGSVVHITDPDTGGGSPTFNEDVVVESVGAFGNTITAFFQSPHTVAQCEVDTICGQPVPLAITYQQFQILAGDPSNPHILYRSKGDKPESFPILPADGSVAAVAAGNPSDPIQNLCEFRGQILTLNKSSLYETVVINGSLQQPAQVGNRGVVSRFAWCKTGSEVWFVATDGVYSWDGGGLRKRSELIDPLFHGQMYNRIQPADMDPGGLDILQMEYYRQEVYLTYRNIIGEVRTLKCNPSMGDRWTILYLNLNVGGTDQPVTYLYREDDTGILIHTRTDPGGPVFNIADTVVVNQLNKLNYTSDEYTTDPVTQGGGIFFNVALPWFDLRSPAVMKAFQEIWLEVFCELGDLTVSVFIDYDEDTAVDTFVVPLQSNTWSLVPLLPNVLTDGPDTSSYGREARAITFFLSGQTRFRQMAFRTLTFQYQETGVVTLGSFRDWMDLGHPYDKRLYQMTVEFDMRGAGQTILLDLMAGNGTYYIDAAASGLQFILTNPVIAGPGRGKQSFPIPDGTIAKLVRIRFWTAGPSGINLNHRILGVEFKKDDYPPDITFFTPWEDGGYEYDKYANQLDLEVNTGGIDIEFFVQADGSNVGFPFTVNTTEPQRRVNLTLAPYLKGKQWRIFVPNQAGLVAPINGRFQLFSHRFSFQKADPGDVVHSEDWKDWGWPWDKRLQVLTIEWDASGQPAPVDITFAMDLLSGIDGGTNQVDVAQFDLGVGTGRSQKAFPLRDGLICKKVKVYPLSTPLPVNFKSWSYKVEFEKFPPDKVYFTEPKQLDWPYDKEGNVITIQIDTGGVNCVVQAWADNVLAGPAFTVNTTLDDWRRELPLPPDQIGRLWKLQLTPDAGGKSQLFDWTLAFQKLPAYAISFTEWEDGGYEYDKFANQLDLEVNTNGIAVTLNVQADGFNIGNPIVVQTTYNNRRVNLTLPPNLQGKKWRIYVDLQQPAIALGSGWFQLFSHRFVFQPADKGDVTHSYDWQDLGYPWDKRLHTLNAEWDNTGGANVRMQMDLLSGIDGGTVQLTVMTFDLGVNVGRSQKPFPLIDGLICKKVKVYPQGSSLPLQLKSWKYDVDFEKFPADIALFTEPNTFNWPYDKLARALVLSINTGGVPCQIQPVADGVAVGPAVTVTTTIDDRQRIVPLQSSPNLIGKLWKLRLTPGSGGMAQLFSFNLDFVKEPPAVDSWDSFEQSLGFSGFKILKELWLKYACEDPLEVTFISDTGSLAITFPAHPEIANTNQRDTERYLFPVVWTPGLNKSKIYSISFSSASPFKLYTDGSKILWYPIGADRHAAYSETALSEFMQIPI